MLVKRQLVAQFQTLNGLRALNLAEKYGVKVGHQVFYRRKHEVDYCCPLTLLAINEMPELLVKMRQLDQYPFQFIYVMKAPERRFPQTFPTVNVDLLHYVLGIQRHLLNSFISGYDHPRGYPPQHLNSTIFRMGQRVYHEVAYLRPNFDLVL